MTGRELSPVEARWAVSAETPRGASASVAPAPPAFGSAADRLRGLYGQMPTTLAGDAFALGVVCMLFGRVAPPGVVAAWTALVSLVWGLRLLHHLRWRRQPESDDATLLRWRAGWHGLVLAQGALWGLAAWLFWRLGTPYHRVTLILVLYSLCVAAAPLLAAQPRVFVGYVAVVLAPMLARLVGDAGDDGQLQLATFVAGLFVATVLLVRGHGSALAHVLRLKARTDELAVQLRAEKTVADDARRAAEAASQAKTRFFAAASHDLRQPLHAVALFVQALRQRAHDPELASLARSLDDSVRALDGLFGELMDLTRLDAGGVESRPAPVPMAALFARLKLHYAPQAFEKGLLLSFRGERHVAQADPLLLERILRNLLSNAIRYTEDGGIVVACRPRRGRLLLQVWDTGVGIPPDALPRIFDEFFQAHAVSGAARVGSGLGLSIVQRLSTLIGAPVAVRSRVGRGSVFSLVVPAAVMQAAARPANGAGEPAAADQLGWYASRT